MSDDEYDYDYDDYYADDADGDDYVADGDPLGDVDGLVDGADGLADGSAAGAVEGGADDEEGAAETAEAAEPEEDFVDVDDDSMQFNTPQTMYKKMIVVKPENRVTTDILTDKNVAAIITQRAAALEMYNDPLIDLKEYPHLRDPVKIAKMELLQKKCPYLLRRRLCDTQYDENGTAYTIVEIWNPNEMIICPEFSMDN